MNTTKAPSTRDLLLETVRANPGIKRGEILRQTGLPSGAIDPARLRLWKAGLIEPVGEEGWDAALNHRIKEVGWQCVDDLTRQAEVADRAGQRAERNAEPTAEEMAMKIVESLQDPVVNRLVLEMTKEGTGSRRAQKRSAQALRAQEIKRKRDAEKAARDNAANANFKRNLARLWEARGAVGAIDQYLVEERARVAQGEARRISDLDWAMALRDVRTIVESFGVMWQNLRDIGGRNEPCPACGALPVSPDRALGTFVIDVEAVEEDISDEVSTPGD